MSDDEDIITKFSDAQIAELKNEFSDLRQLSYESVIRASTDIRKLLMLVNSGGAVTTLTYIGNAKSQIFFAEYILLSFIVGIVAIGFCYSNEYFRLLKHQTSVEENAADFLLGKIGHERCSANIANAGPINWRTFILPTISGFSAVAALLLGACSFIDWCTCLFT